MIIAIGIMFTFNIAGIETNSNLIMDNLLLNNNVSAEINPNVGTITSPSGIASSPSYWWAIMSFFWLTVGLSIVGAFIGGQRAESLINAAISGIAIFLFGMFSLDLIGILVKMYDITDGIGWMFNLTWIIIVPFVVGFAYSLINFVQGTE
jgi:hypothetical protein